MILPINFTIYYIMQFTESSWISRTIHSNQRIVTGIWKWIRNITSCRYNIINHGIKTGRKPARDERGRGHTGGLIKLLRGGVRYIPVTIKDACSLKSFHLECDQWVTSCAAAAWRPTKLFCEWNTFGRFIKKRMVLWCSSSIFLNTTYEWYSDGHYSKIKHSSTKGHNSNTEQDFSFKDSLAFVPAFDIVPEREQSTLSCPDEKARIPFKDSSSASLGLHSALRGFFFSLLLLSSSSSHYSGIMSRIRRGRCSS